MTDTAPSRKKVFASLAKPQPPLVATRKISIHSPGPGVSPDFSEHLAVNPEQLAEVESQSSQRTREALLALDDCPRDTSALQTLWEENHLAFEREMSRYFRSPASSALLKRVLHGVVSLSRFYCQEIDDPKAWVARCVNLESRRAAFQLAR